MTLVLSRRFRRDFIQSRNLLEEARARIKDYESVMGRTWADYEVLRTTGIPCRAFTDEGGEPDIIEVTRQCWNHVFKHSHKRASKIDKLERALCFPLVLKLLRRTTTYQEVSREKDRGGNSWLYFGIIGYIRGVRVKVIIRKQEKNTNAKKVLFSFFQTSSAPVKTQKRQDAGV